MRHSFLFLFVLQTCYINGKPDSAAIENTLSWYVRLFSIIGPVYLESSIAGLSKTKLLTSKPRIWCLQGFWKLQMPITIAQLSYGVFEMLPNNFWGPKFKRNVNYRLYRKLILTQSGVRHFQLPLKHMACLLLHSVFQGFPPPLKRYVLPRTRRSLLLYWYRVTQTHKHLSHADHLVHYATKDEKKSHQNSFLGKWIPY